MSNHAMDSAQLIPQEPSTAKKLMEVFRMNLTVLLSLGILFLILKITHWFYDVFAILGGALLLTYLLLGPVNTVDDVFQGLAKKIRIPWPVWVERNILHPLSHHLSLRVFAVLVVYLSFGMVITVGTSKLIPVLSRDLGEFTQDLPIYLNQLDTHLEKYTKTPEGKLFLEKINHREKIHQHPNTSSSSPNLVWTEDEEADETLLKPSEIISKNAIGQIVMYFQKSGPKAFHDLMEVATTTMEGLIYLIATLVIIFYLLLDGNKLKQSWVDFLPASISPTMNAFLMHTHQMLFHFLKGQIVLSLLAGGYMWLVYSFFGLKYAGFLAAFFGLASILPMVGPWVGIAPAILVLVFSNHQTDMTAVLLLAASFYLLKEFWLNRLITGNKVHIHPVIFLLSFLTCIKMTGAVGILLSFPVASLLYALIRFAQDHSRSLEFRSAESQSV
jgi:predicted PurR-regulated permease PerM